VADWGGVFPGGKGPLIFCVAHPALLIGKMARRSPKAVGHELLPPLTGLFILLLALVWAAGHRCGKGGKLLRAPAADQLKRRLRRGAGR